MKEIISKIIALFIIFLVVLALIGVFSVGGPGPESVIVP